MEYDEFNGSKYLELLKFLYNSDNQLTYTKNPSGILYISNKLSKLFPNVCSMDPDDFYNVKFGLLVDSYWDGGGNNYNTHFETDDESFGPEDVFIDEISSLVGYFPSNHYQNFYYMFGSGKNKYYNVTKNKYDLTRIDLLNVIHHLIATYDFYKPFGYSLSYFNNDRESQNIKLINKATLQTISHINNYAMAEIHKFHDYDKSCDPLFSFVSQFNRICLKSCKFLDDEN